MDKLYSINTIPYGHFKHLIIKETKLSEIEIENQEEFIYFYTEPEAKIFLKKLKEFILENYSRARESNWYEENSL